jgi:hypothetical protein
VAVVVQRLGEHRHAPQSLRLKLSPHGARLSVAGGGVTDDELGR